MASPARRGETSEVERLHDLPPRRRVFVNRNLRLESIAAIGFDMDHTLAIYQTEAFNELCIGMAKQRLMEVKGYPREIDEVTDDPAAAVRGLIVDKREGNLLKVDAYNYVTRVRHGLRFSDRQARRQIYRRGRIRVGRPRYRIFDTLFDLPEGGLYSQLVALKDSEPKLIRSSYEQLFKDIRETMDTLHADGSLKARITADLDRYFLKDPELEETLRRYRDAGKRLFLLTNSELDYTAAVMNHLFSGRKAWEEHFDLVICSARKPRFFVAQGAGKAAGRDPCPGLANRERNCFIGGDSFWLEQKIGAFGDAILYFGDHTYGDILRSKKSVGWRTAMIVPEIEDEVTALAPRRRDLHRVAEIEEQLEDLVRERDRLRAAAAQAGPRVAELDTIIARQLSRRAVLQKRIKTAFNPYWESLFREGRAASRFGRQIQEFACIYTSRVSNFINYPVDKFYARPPEILPHERWAYLGP